MAPLNHHSAAATPEYVVVGLTYSSQNVGRFIWGPVLHFRNHDAGTRSAGPYPPQPKWSQLISVSSATCSLCPASMLWRMAHLSRWPSFSAFFLLAVFFPFVVSLRVDPKQELYGHFCLYIGEPSLCVSLQ